MSPRLLSLGYLVATLVAAGAESAPEWLWFNKTSGTDVRFFRKEFQVEGRPKHAELTATADDTLEVFINGELVLKNDNWRVPRSVDVTPRFKRGSVVLVIRASNKGASNAGVLAKLELDYGSRKQVIVTDASWQASAGEEDHWNHPAFKPKSVWSAPSVLGKLGVKPWGDVFAAAKSGQNTDSGKAIAKREATPADSLWTLPGFKVELLHSAEPDEGSWVAMSKDDKGRLLISPQHAKGLEGSGGLLRITLGKDGSIAKREFIGQPLFDAQGLLFAHNSIYAVVNRYSTTFESGLYRLRDTSGDDRFSDIELIKAFPGSGEHGPHTVELGPDGNLYVLAGNHTKLIDGLDSDSPMRNWQEDQLLPRQWDGNGHATGILAPGGYIVRVDPRFKKWELFCAGFRNPYHFAFNTDGELFTYDADMEWDWGMPWYRPTRVNHCVSGGEYGWRAGTGKWPDYYPDSLGAIDIGIGCPTGVKAGKGAKFPAKYQRALYILDWTYARLIAVHLTPNGASYTGRYENFLCPLGLVQPGAEKRPLNITDLVIGDDGAMYFIVGGRGVQAGLYRVSYTGKESTKPAYQADTTGAEARKLRRQIEAFHGKADTKAVDFLWPHLNSKDRAIRFAARVALEAQPVAQWRDRALSETSVHGGLTALLALARIGGKETQADLLGALKKFPLKTLSEAQQLDKLRVIEVSFSRQGRPSAELVKLGIDKLSPLYPNKSELLNRELSQLLIFLEAPDVVGKTMTLLTMAKTQEEQMHYLFHLRTAKNWTLERRQQYFTLLGRKIAEARNVDYFEPSYPGTLPGPMPISKDHPAKVMKWFQEAGRPYGDGASFPNFLRNFFNEAVANLTAAEKEKLQPILASVDLSGRDGKRAIATFPAPTERAFVKEWTTADLEPSLDQVGRGRNFQKGMQAFVDAQCIACHRFGNEGGGVGPDLTAVSARFSRRDILESILEPSKVVSEQYQNTTVVLKNGDDVTGRLVNETPDKLVLQPNPLAPDVVEVKKSDVESRDYGKLSPMPEGLLNGLAKNDVLDLLAFIESVGRRNYSAFSK